MVIASGAAVTWSPTDIRIPALHLLSRFSSYSTASPETPKHLGTRHTGERRETPRSDLRGERLKDLGGVAVGLDVVPGPLDPALAVDQEGRAQHPDAGLAIPALLPPGAVGVHDLVVGVGQQRELEAVLVAEALVALGIVGRDADDRHAGGLEGGQVVVELARLTGAARGIVRGIEVDEYLGALEVL